MADDRFAEGYAVGKDNSVCYYPPYGGGYGGGFGNFGGLGGEWGGIIGLIAVASIFGNGGIFGNNNRGNCATQADLAAGFNNSAVLSSLNDIKLGQQQAINYNNQGFSGLNTAILQGFHCLDNAICTLGYQNQAGVNQLSNQIAACCCDLKQLNLENRYLNEKQTCEIVTAINAGNQRLVDIYTNDKIAALTAENTALKGQISNDKQTANIVSQLRDPGCPVASYVVPNPNCCYNNFGLGYGFGGTPFGGGCCGASVQ